MSSDQRLKEHAPATDRPEARQQVAPTVESAHPSHLQAARLSARGTAGISGASATEDGLMALQRTAGNRAVASLLAPVQRWPSMDDARDAGSAIGGAISGMGDTIATAAGSVAGATDGDGGAGPSLPTGSEAADPTATSLGGPGSTTINGTQIELAAPMVRAPGVLQVDTLIANNVVGSSYTPGAGNVW